MTARKLLCAAYGTALALPVAANAATAGDDVARLELGVGYALLYRPQEQPSLLPLGLAVDLAVNPLPSIGIVGEASALYSEGPDAAREIAALGGVRYSIRRRALVVSLEALGGGARRTEGGDGPSEASWQGALQAGTALSFKVGPDVLLRASLSFRTPLGQGELSRGFRFYLGATLGLRRSRGAGGIPGASGLQGATLGPRPTPDPPPSTVGDATTFAPEPAPATEAGPPPSPSPPTAPPSVDVQLPARNVPLPPSTADEPSPPDRLARGRDLLRSGRYPEAASAFQSELRLNAAGQFTVAVGIYCEIDNLGQLVQRLEETVPLMVLPSPRGGRPCYAVYWGLFPSYEEARAALASLPSALRAGGQRPIAVSRILR